MKQINAWGRPWHRDGATRSDIQNNYDYPGGDTVVIRVSMGAALSPSAAPSITFTPQGSWITIPYPDAALSVPYDFPIFEWKCMEAVAPDPSLDKLDVEPPFYIPADETP